MVVFFFASVPLIYALMFSPRLPKIKAWIDTNNPGDPLIPFSVSLEERLLKLSEEDQEAELKNIGTQSALGKITQAGYSSLDVRATRAFSTRV
jgi:ribosome-binding ATPase YchF (GTP1/OBG family)